MGECLERKGVTSGFMGILKAFNIYIYAGHENHERKIRMVGGYTDWIKCEVGVKQGCVLSHTLFAIYIADLGGGISKG